MCASTPFGPKSSTPSFPCNLRLLARSSEWSPGILPMSSAVRRLARPPNPDGGSSFAAGSFWTPDGRHMRAPGALPTLVLPETLPCREEPRPSGFKLPTPICPSLWALDCGELSPSARAPLPTMCALALLMAEGGFRGLGRAGAALCFLAGFSAGAAAAYSPPPRYTKSPVVATGTPATVTALGSFDTETLGSPSWTLSFSSVQLASIDSPALACAIARIRASSAAACIDVCSSCDIRRLPPDFGLDAGFGDLLLVAG
mmetsp:Transcript_77411/g.185518  ORF Transcript_77411/g.185518 Transcript_77411/m.185518 type:complete len:258 (-) Transcript_77411:380-1153(-)